MSAPPPESTDVPVVTLDPGQFARTQGELEFLLFKLGEMSKRLLRPPLGK